MEVSGKARRRRHLSQINVTPFVDVMLVLLIIFMVTAPMMQEGMDVSLPKVEAAAIVSSDEPLIITVDGAGRIYLNKRRFKAGELSSKLSAVKKANPGITVLLRADASVEYGTVMEAMAEIRRGGIDRVGMVTEPPERNSR